MPPGPTEDAAALETLRSLRGWLRWCAVLLTVAAAFFLKSVLVPIALAVFAALLLDPFVTAAERRGRSRGPVVAVTVLLVFALLGAGGWAVYASANHGLEQLPALSRRLREVLPGWAGSPTSLQARLLEEAYRWRSWMFGALGSVFEALSFAVFVPLLAFYFLLNKSDLVETLNTLGGRILFLPRFNAEIPRMVRSFFRGNLIGGAILVLAHGAVYLALGLKYVPALAVTSGILNLIPLVGAPLALVLPVAQGILQWTSPEIWPFVTLASATLLLHLVVGNIVLPALVGTRMNVSPAALVAGMLFWGWLWGPVGFLLGIPLTAAIKIALECNRETYVLSNLLSARPRHVIQRPETPNRARARSNAPVS